MASKIKRLKSYSPVHSSDFNQEIIDSDTISTQPKSFVLVSKTVENTFLALIIINSIIMGIGTFDFISEHARANAAFYYCDLAFLLIFTIELGLTIFYRKYDIFKDPWAIFDFVIIGGSWILSIMDSFDPQGEGGEGVQVVRSLRVLRIISKVDSFREVFVAFGRSLPKLGCVAIFTFIMQFIFGVFFTERYGDMYKNGQTELDYFSRLDYTFFTLLQLMTLDNWINVLREIMNTYPFSWIPFVLYEIFGAYIVFNLIIAIICDSIFEIAKGRENERKKSRNLKHINQLLSSKYECIHICNKLNIRVSQTSKDEASTNRLDVSQAPLNIYIEQEKSTGTHNSMLEGAKNGRVTSSISAPGNECVSSLAGEIKRENKSKRMGHGSMDSADVVTFLPSDKMAEESKNDIASGTSSLPDSVDEITSVSSNKMSKGKKNKNCETGKPTEGDGGTCLNKRSSFPSNEGTKCIYQSITKDESGNPNPTVDEDSSLSVQTKNFQSGLTRSTSFSAFEDTTCIDQIITKDESGNSKQSVDQDSSLSVQTRNIRPGLTRNLCGYIVNHKYVQRFAVFVIVVNSVIIAIGSFDFVTSDDALNSKFDMVNNAFLSIYTIEISMQLIYHGRKLLNDAWLVFDLILVLLSWALSVSPAFRVFRVLRLVLLFPKFMVMRVIVGTLCTAIPRISPIAGILLVNTYVFAIMITGVCKDIPIGGEGGLSSDYCGRLDTTFLSLFQMMTMEGWAEISRELSEHVWWAHFFSMIFVTVTGLLYLKAIVAVICRAFDIFESSINHTNQIDSDEATHNKLLLDVQDLQINILNSIGKSEKSLEIGTQFRESE